MQEWVFAHCDYPYIHHFNAFIISFNLTQIDSKTLYYNQFIIVGYSYRLDSYHLWFMALI